MKISIIGTGRVGVCLALLLKKDFQIAGLSNNNYNKIIQLKKFFPDCSYLGTDNKICAQEGDIIFITTPDNCIDIVDKEIFGDFKLKNKYVFHCSGCNPSSILKNAKKNGCYIGSIHPLQSVPDIEKGIENLKNAYFCIEGNHKAVDVAKNIVNKISGKYFTIQTEFKPLYHLGAVFSSNFINTLVFITAEIYKKIGVSDNYNEILNIIMPLINGAVNGIKNLGIVNALTGPVVRGDSDTIKKHILELEKEFPELKNLYVDLAKQTVKLALKQVDNDTLDKINNLKEFLEKAYGNKT